MPAQRPRASFDPIAPDFDLEALVENTENFQFVDRISCDMIDQNGLEAFDRLVYLHVVVGGKPLVIDGYQSRLDPWTFSSKWLQDNRGDRVEEARDLRKEHLYTPLTVGHYLRNMSKLAEQYFEKRDNYRDLDRQRVYLKDIDCPEVWQDKLREQLPPNLFYLNDSIGVLGGPGSVDEVAPGGGRRKGKGIASAGDLMSSLPPHMRAENMMCYIGHEGTYTPAHREMCASLGHNIMVETSDVLGDDGKPEKPGSSIWFMTESKDRHTVSEYWLSILGHDIEVEKHFAQVVAWQKAPFKTYIVEQKAGDFILIPPLAPHQVWNRGTRTMKAAWNRTTVETLEMAFAEALPNARMVCRDEQYKNKAIVYYTLQKYSALLAKARDQEQTASSPQEAESIRSSPRISQMRKDFKKLFNLFKGILLSEMFIPDSYTEKNVQYIPFESNITCAYCRGNIFNRFLTCGSCEDLLGTAEPEPYDICMECYAMGRSCGCVSKLRWSEQFKWKELLQNYELWRRQFIETDSGKSKHTPPLPLQEERQRLAKKTLAQICQEQLKRRPWIDVRKVTVQSEDEESDGTEEIQMNEDGTVKKPKKRRSAAWLKNRHACHVCAHRHEKWKMAECKCGKWWCYGSLFRGHDLMPLQIMEDPNWQCPHCHGVCNAGACRKDPRQKSYEPKGTLLGHDTKKVADERSIESLVDFSVSNLGWLKETTKAPTDNARLRKRQEEAERNKLDDPVDEQETTDVEGIAYLPATEDSSAELQNTEDSLIDPALRNPIGTSFVAANKPNGTKVPAVSAGSNKGESESLLQGYEPALPTGYVAPEATDDLGDVQMDGSADDAEVEDISTENSGRKKRKDATDSENTPVKSPKARRRDDRLLDGKPVSSATKQYRKEKERQALEEARRKGRFILTHAKLRSKTRIVRLAVGRVNMAEFAARDVQHNGSISNDLLRSDVQPEEPPEPAPVTTLAPNKPSKAVRIRVEKDDDFRSRQRRQKAAGGIIASARKKKHPSAFEEIEIESDSDNNADSGLQLDGTSEAPRSGGEPRRISTWQSKLHQDDSDELPEELPDDWKDGMAGRKRDYRNHLTSRMSKLKPAGKGIAQIRPGKRPRGRPPKLKPLRESAKNQNSKAWNGTQAEPGAEDKRAKQLSTALAAVEIVEGLDQQAKSAATEMPERDGSGGAEDAYGRDDEDVEDEDDSMPGVKPVASLFTRVVDDVMSGSILSKERPGHRKIKIVGKRKAAQA